MNSPSSHNKAKAINKLQNSKARTTFWFRSLAILVFIINISFHLVLWWLQMWHPISLLSLLLFLLLIPFWRKHKKYQSHIWQNERIRKALGKISTSYQYYPDKFMPESDFIHSKLYNNVTFRYSGSHLFQDESLSISISNVLITHEISNQQAPIFDGVFAKVYCQSGIHNSFIIKPAYSYKNQHLPEVFKKLFQRYIPDHYQVIQTTNEQFNQEFDIYAKAENLQLSDAFLQQILKIKEKLMEFMHQEKTSGRYAVFTSHSLLKNSPLEISITDNYIFLGIRNMKIFSPPLEKNIKESTRKSIEIISLISQLGKLSKSSNQ